MRVLLSALSLLMLLSGIVGGAILIRGKQTQRGLLFLSSMTLVGMALLTWSRRLG